MQASKEDGFAGAPPLWEEEALASARPLRRAATLESFREDVWARSNIGPQDARWKTFCRVCPAWQIAPLPLCPNVVEKVAASFKAGGYRSGKQYFCRARREHIVLQLKCAVPAEVEMAIRDAQRSLERGLGVTSFKDAFRLEDLKLPEDPAVASMVALRSSCIVLLGSWFLMRELELAA